MMVLPLVANADAVEINGIYYNLIAKGNVAEVTSNPNKYTGSVVIPEAVSYQDVSYSVTTIGEIAFSGCSELTSVTIPNSVTTIGYSAFYQCFGLTSFIIPNSVTTIDDNAFYQCTNLTSINIPNSVTTIGKSAFAGCFSLTSVSIPNSVTIIDTGVFGSCKSLTSVTIPNSVTSIGYSAFGGCTSLTSINISSSVLNIDRSAFHGCISLTSVSIPNSVTGIGESAFFGCTSLTSITIGSGVKKIYGTAFASCSKLTDVTCYAESVPNTSSDAFKDSYIEYTTLHVPSALINAYKAADPWKNFKSIVAIDGETPEPPTSPKCEKPTISYENGQLKFASATDGAEFVSEITDSDIKKNYEATVSLTATYNISVYATKSGYENSETATATLCWIDATPQTEGITDGVAQIAARPVLVKTDNGFITVEGAEDRTNVSIYTTDGKQVGSVISQNNIATIATSIQPGSIAIVKMGEKSVKVVMK